ncbi:MAG: siroheme synthase, n-terminal [Thermomicrobiales bacterium]|nr:siroheme synthase, n-terminal [Thermomicrobiales bacterium]
MTPTCYPIALVLEGKPCLVAGGGEIADGKLDALLLAGAIVTVVSPEVRPRIARDGGQP